jgi:hypothetical protein
MIEGRGSQLGAALSVIWRKSRWNQARVEEPAVAPGLDAVSNKRVGATKNMCKMVF